MKLVAHRLGHRQFNELENSNNLITLINNANDIDTIETDLRFTKDNKLILYHDFNIYRTTKKYQRISNHKYELLNNRILNHTKYTIPIFPDFLKDLTNKKWHLELKYCYKMNKQKINLLSKYLKDNSHITVVSFFPSLIKKIKNFNPSVKVGLFTFYYYLDKHNYYDLVYIRKEYAFYTKQLQKLLDNGHSVGISKINSEKDLKKLLRNINPSYLNKYHDKIYLLTDYPQIIDNLINKY